MAAEALAEVRLHTQTSDLRLFGIALSQLAGPAVGGTVGDRVFQHMVRSDIHDLWRYVMANPEALTVRPRAL